MSEQAFAGYKQEGVKVHGLSGRPLTPIGPEDELLHPPAVSGHHSSTETLYYGFSIPQHALNGEIYIWLHPVLRVMSTSIYIWKGFKTSTLACEYINHYHYLPFPQNDVGDFTIEDIGLSIKVIDPLRTTQIEFRDPVRDVEFSLRMDAIMPPAGRPDGYHFTQAMKTSGALRLYDETFTIDGFFSRDHSWGQERRETAQSMPPLSWMVGVFDENFAFHAMAFDDPAWEPEWKSKFPGVAAGDNLFWGYIFNNGALVPLKSAGKITHREKDGLAPKLIELNLVDVNGEQYAIKGSVQARMPWQTWQNMNTFFCQTRWEMNDRIGWGDTQDVQFNEFTRHFAR
jgi:hypothetical protein